jgi:hypothetical protein
MSFGLRALVEKLRGGEKGLLHRLQLFDAAVPRTFSGIRRDNGTIDWRWKGIFVSMDRLGLRCC